jgi:hypothetical protein
MFLPKYFKQILTEPDNKTFCPVRSLALLGSLQYLVLCAMNYFQHAVFDPQGYAVGFGALLGGVGVALKLKKDSSDAPTSSTSSTDK